MFFAPALGELIPLEEYREETLLGPTPRDVSLSQSIASQLTVQLTPSNAPASPPAASATAATRSSPARAELPRGPGRRDFSTSRDETELASSVARASPSHITSRGSFSGPRPSCLSSCAALERLSTWLPFQSTETVGARGWQQTGPKRAARRQDCLPKMGTETKAESETSHPTRSQPTLTSPKAASPPGPDHRPQQRRERGAQPASPTSFGKSR